MTTPSFWMHETYPMTDVSDTRILDGRHAPSNGLQPEGHAVTCDKDLDYQARADEERVICVEEGGKAGQEDVIIRQETTWRE